MFKEKLVLVPFPFTDLSGQKIRPALILHDSKGGEDCVVAFISGIKQKKVGPFDIAVTATPNNGLKQDSVIKLNKIATLQKKIILGEIGTLEPAILASISKKLKILFDL